MKKLFYIFLFFTQLICAKTPFEKGNEFYTQEKYQDAVDSYESVLKNGQESAELYFNLGNAYYKLNKIAPAIYNYEKALLLSPNNKEIKNNLEFARKMTIDDIKPIPKTGFSKLLNNITGFLHYDAWARRAVFFSSLFLFLFVGYYFTGKTMLKRIFFGGMAVSLLLMILCVGAGFFVKSQFEKERPAIIFSESVEIKSEPNDRAETTFNLHEGTKVYILENLNNWVRIQLADEKEGWMKAQNIKELKL